ncbi:hypothetical protein SAMN05421821_10943 [Mucilaginibacter lappiensis]|uniref:Uncharacterized protein n=1 Tax=Mucilaginibacter lappiensis TaxID=354630 RepID=A0ABR6PRN6_9SPHI|nr:hypothetical protein [Mucilaginibacter lappiensis]SIR60001.1 hypothetical protein SAMN05421821_10943 [Mucilaginibacter lappiensis]
MQSSRIFTNPLTGLAISGRKSATYYACIKNVPNTVLNFGIFYNIHYCYIFILNRIKFHIYNKNNIKYFFQKKFVAIAILYCYIYLTNTDSYCTNKPGSTGRIIYKLVYHTK